MKPRLNVWIFYCLHLIELIDVPTGEEKETGRYRFVGDRNDQQLLPTTDVQLSYVGGQKTKSSFTAPPSDFMPWDKIQVAVGDLPVFSQLLVRLTATLQFTTFSMTTKQRLP